jgi:hypothetical protein
MSPFEIASTWLAPQASPISLHLSRMKAPERLSFRL